MYVLVTQNDDLLRDLVASIAGQGGFCRLWTGRRPPFCSGYNDPDTPVYIVGHANGNTFTGDRINIGHRVTGAQVWADIVAAAPDAPTKPFIVILGCSAAGGTLAADIAAASGLNVIAGTVPVSFSVSRIGDMATGAIANTPGGFFHLVTPARDSRLFMSVVDDSQGVPRHVTGERWQGNQAVPLIACTALTIRLYD